LGIPAFFTPNQGGYSYWNIEGVSDTSGKKQQFSFFDRYGRNCPQINSLKVRDGMELV